MHIRNSVKIIFREWRKESSSDDYLFNKKDKKEEMGLIITVGSKLETRRMQVYII